MFNNYLPLIVSWLQILLFGGKFHIKCLMPILVSRLEFQLLNFKSALLQSCTDSTIVVMEDSWMDCLSLVLYKFNGWVCTTSCGLHMHAVFCIAVQFSALMCSFLRWMSFIVWRSLISKLQVSSWLDLDISETNIGLSRRLETGPWLADPCSELTLFQNENI